MRRKRQRSAAVDLIGFMDIISTLVIIVLLLLSLLALSMGEQKRSSSPPESTAKPKKQESINIYSTSGVLLNTSVTFLMCDDKSVSQYNPNTLEMSHKFSISGGDLGRQLLLHSTGSRTYLAVKPSCFDKYKNIVSVIKNNGGSVGFEPVLEGSRYPWESNNNE
jgi:hypothetical protein